MSITNIHGLRLYNTSNEINARDSKNTTIISQNSNFYKKIGEKISAEKFKKARDFFEGCISQDATNKIKEIDQDVSQIYNPLTSKKDTGAGPLRKEQNILKIDVAKFSKINYTCSNYLKSLSKFSLPSAYYLNNIKSHQAKYMAAKHKLNELLNQIISEIKIFNLFMMTNEVVPMPEIALSEGLKKNPFKKENFYFTRNKKLHGLSKIHEILKKTFEIVSIYNNICLLEEINIFIELNEGLINNLKNHDIDYITTINDPRILRSLHSLDNRVYKIQAYN